MSGVCLSMADLSAVFHSLRREVNEAAAPARLARLLGLEAPGEFSGCSHTSAGFRAELLQWNEGPKLLTFHTSGTTGEPRPQVHEFAALVEEAGLFAPLFAGCGRVVSVMPVHHIYGFVFSLVLPKVLERPVELFSPMLTADLLTSLRSNDMLVAFPFFWEHLLRAEERLPNGVLGISATAPLPAAVWEGLLDRGFAGLTEVYGTSESSALGLRRSPEGPFTLLPYWKKEIDSAGECSGFTRRLPSGGVRHHLLLDTLTWTGDRTFVPVGRMDGTVQVAGVNVRLVEVEQCLRGIPGVKDCRVRRMRREEGSRLKAFVVPEVHAFLTTRELRRRLQARLPAPAVPRVFTFGSALPRTATGKAADWSIAGGISENTDDD